MKANMLNMHNMVVDQGMQFRSWDIYFRTVYGGSEAPSPRGWDRIGIPLV